MLEVVLTAIVLGIILSLFMIGPIYFILIETSVIKGFRAAFIFDLGAVLADIIYIIIAFFSSFRLVQSLKDDPSIFIFGGILMFTYGLISFLKSNKTNRNFNELDLASIKKTNYVGLFIKGFLLNFINVGVLFFWVLILLTVSPKLKLDISLLILFFSSVLITYLLVDIGKILLAKKLKSKMTPKIIINTKKITNLLLIIFGISIMLQGWFPSENKLVKKVLEKVETSKQ